MRLLRFLPIGLVILMSCSRESFEGETFSGTGEVEIALSSTGTAEIRPGTKSKEENVPDADVFEVEIYNSRGIRLYRDTYANTVGKKIPLNSGEYRLLAQYGDSAGIGFNAAWFAADQTFTVRPQTSESVSAVARMMKVKVAVVHGVNIQSDYEDFYSLVKLDGSDKDFLKFTSDETRCGYIPAGELTYELYVKEKGASEWKYFKAEPVAYDPNDFVTFNVDVNKGSGSLGGVTIDLDVTVDGITKEYEIPSSAAPKDAPAIALRGFAEDSFSFVEAMSYPGTQADFVAMGGIKSCVLGIGSSALSSLGIPSSVDFASEMDPSMEKLLKSAGFSWIKDMSGKRIACIDFSSFGLSHKYDASSPFEATFTLSVTDMLDQTTEYGPFTLSQRPASLEFSPADFNAYARRFSGISASTPDGQAALLSLQYSLDGQSWTTVANNSVSGNQASFPDVTGLAESTEYQLRVIYNGNESNVSEPVRLTTEDILQVENAGFETWHSKKLYSQSVLWAKNTIYSYYPWAEGASDHFWDTVNTLTTPNPGGSSVWDYRSAPGVVPTSEVNETASNHLRTRDNQTSLKTEGHNGIAAEIATVGWGSGNTWVDGSHPASDRTAGQLYIGTYGSPVEYGKAFASRPSAVTFWYKFHPYNSETTTPYVEIYDASGDRIGYGQLKITSETAEFTQGRIDITYTVLAKAGDITIVFSSTDSDSPATKDVQGGSGAMSGYLDSRHIGSIFTVDDVELVYE